MELKEHNSIRDFTSIRIRMSETDEIYGRNYEKAARIKQQKGWSLITTAHDYAQLWPLNKNFWLEVLFPPHRPSGYCPGF